MNEVDCLPVKIGVHFLKEYHRRFFRLGFRSLDQELDALMRVDVYFSLGGQLLDDCRQLIYTELVQAS